jgi:tRNA nucleotidyltransferase/poly(A) polymerase
MSQSKSNRLYKAGEKVVRLLNKKGNTAFFVGGVVRNDLIQRVSDNIDIATDATPDQIEKILGAQDIKVKPVGKKFGSILAIVDSFPIEITTFRAEGRYSDNRHPDEVEFIKDYGEDAKRRDFTINALYYDPLTKELLDPTEKGMKDLKAKLLRFVGNPRKRIDEDGLRMLRGVRLATQLGLKLEKNSFAAIKTRAKYIQDISGERIKAELDKILLSENRVEGIKLLDKTGLLKFIIPEFEKLKKVYHLSKRYHLEGDIFTHTLRAVEVLKTNNLDVIYATLFHDVGKVIKPTKVFKKDEWVLSYRGHIPLSAEIFLKFASKFRFPYKNSMVIHWLIQHHDDRQMFKDKSEVDQIKYMLQLQTDLLLEVWRADSLANIKLIDGEVKTRISDAYTKGLEIWNKIKNVKDFKLASGDLIMKYSNIRPGSGLGKKIEDVKAQIVLGNIQNIADLKKYLNP